MSVNKFKVGDVVKCVDSGDFNNLTTGKDYVLLDVSDDGEIKVENDVGRGVYYYSYRFELSGANAQQPSKFKEGDMVYLIGFNHFKPCKLLTTGDNYLTKRVMIWKIFFEVKPVLAIAIVTAIEEIVEKYEGVFSPDELNELERVAKAIERQVHETN